MTAPPGFTVELVAAEPDIAQPIAFAFDARGRIWLVECHSYPHWLDKEPGKDRVVILEDTDGDGSYETRKVVLDNGTNLSGIALGHGGVWLASVPNIIFVPIDAKTDKPSGPAVVKLDGFDLKAKHNVVSTLTWGPDGWLYGCNGILSHAKIGKPGTPEAERVKMDCGVWRYNIESHKVEAFAHGTTNPWGLDFDAEGEAFITNCVIKHLWHLFPGGHYERMFGEDVVPHTYTLMPSVADHIHWAGGDWKTAIAGKANSDAGGGHAHSGAAFINNGSWPKEYQGSLLTCNIHGSRLNRNTFEKKGSSYVGKFAPDFVFANDPWFRGIAVHQGPDDAVYMIDWCDTGECHNYDKADKSNGRIYKIRYGKGRKPVDLRALSDEKLVAEVVSSNETASRLARLVLHERRIAKALGDDVLRALRQRMREAGPAAETLRWAWALHLAGGMTETDLATLYRNRSESVRSWAVRLDHERGLSPDLYRRTVQELDGETSPRVLAHVAGQVQKWPSSILVRVAGPLLKAVGDAEDPYLWRMVWYGLADWFARHPELAREALAEVKQPALRGLVARRLLSRSGDFHRNVSDVAADLWRLPNEESALILAEIEAALRGRPGKDTTAFRILQDGYQRRTVGGPVMPVGAWVIGAMLDFDPAFDVLEAYARPNSHPNWSLADRVRAMEACITYRPDRIHYERFVSAAFERRGSDLRPALIRLLAKYDKPEVAQLLVGKYADLTPTERADAVQTLAVRGIWAEKLLDAIDAGKIPRADVSVTVARQIQQLDKGRLKDRLAKSWGQVRSVGGDRQKLLAEYKTKLPPGAIAKGDKALGKQVYAKSCGTCHKLFDEGGDVGPALTGAQRQSLDYLLENVLDPSAVVAREYKATTFDMKDGRTLVGMVRSETPHAIVLRTSNETLTLAKADVEARRESQQSMMPEGILDAIKEKELADLFAYLMGGPTEAKKD